MIFKLLHDFAFVLDAMPAEHPQRRILALLEEAIRRDMHFIDRHPTTLFQCLWNSCWWYDCPEAARHYQERNAPGETAGVELHRLLEFWQGAKKKRSPGFVWLRSLRPPPQHLGIALKALFKGHTGEVTGVAFSPDGTRLATGSEDKTVRLWDAHSGQQLVCVQGHTSAVSSVAFSPDGTRLVSSSADKTVRLWDAYSGQQLVCVQGHTRAVRSVAFSPDGARLASGSDDKSVRLWDARSGERLVCRKGHAGPVDSVAFSPDGTRLASGSDDNTVRIWDAQRGHTLACLKGHTGPVDSVAFSPDGTRLASGSYDQTVRLWDAQSGAALGCWEGHASGVRSIAFSPDGTRLGSGSYDQTVRLWDARSGTQLACLEGHLWVNVVAFSPDGQRIVSGSQDRTVRLWDSRGGTRLFDLQGHTHRGVRRLGFTLDGTRLVSASEEFVRVWDAFHGACLEVRDGGIEEDIADGASTFPWHVCSDDHETWLNSISTGQSIAWLALPLDRRAVHPLCHTWAGINYEYVALFTLEGKPPG